jgi:4'-phosphopantetheinyl transferase
MMDDNNILWPSPSSDLPLDLQATHVWAVSLQVSPEVLSRFGNLLDSSEQNRAARFHFEHDRNRYIAGRGALREILAHHLDEPPADIQFGSTPRGKPFLTGHFAQSGVHFNLAHCEDLAVVAVSRQPYVGIDLERIRPVDGALEMAPFFCSARERAEFQSVPLLEREIAFFRLWTRKEALLKATGQGIGEALEQVEVTFQPNQPPRLLQMPEDLARVSTEWCLRELTPAPGFMAALAQPRPAASLRCWNATERQPLAYV